MKKILSIMLLLLATFTMQAQTATAIFSKTLSTFKAAGVVSAGYSMGSSKGTIVMNGSKFRVLANDLKAWYDGKTQWTYSKATGEVNVTSPSPQELVMVNPLAAAQSIKAAYNMSATKTSAFYLLKLTPKRKSNVKSITLYITKGGYQLSKAIYTTAKGSTTLKITNYKTHANYPVSTFKFQKSLVPAGSEVVDLR